MLGRSVEILQVTSENPHETNQQVPLIIKKRKIVSWNVLNNNNDTAICRPKMAKFLACLCCLCYYWQVTKISTDWKWAWVFLWADIFYRWKVWGMNMYPPWISVTLDTQLATDCVRLYLWLGFLRIDPPIPPSPRLWKIFRNDL